MKMAEEFDLTEGQMTEIIETVEKKVLVDVEDSFTAAACETKAWQEAAIALPDHTFDTLEGMAKLLSQFKNDISKASPEAAAMMNQLSEGYKEVREGLVQQNDLKAKAKGIMEKVGMIE